MTRGEEERLSVVETQIDTLQRDVSEIKADVKVLVGAQQALSIAFAAQSAREEQHAKDRASTGVWVRSMVPWVLSGVGIALTIINSLDLLVDWGRF